MLATDYILANTDRHLGNFGFLRDSETLEWKGLAPIYDSGTSLWQMTLTRSISAEAMVPAIVIHQLVTNCHQSIMKR